MNTTPRGTLAKEAKVPADMAKARFRGALGVELRMQGCTYDELAVILEYSHRSAARKAVMRTIKERSDMAVDAYRVQRFLATEDTLGKSLPAALKGEPRALARCLRCIDERAMLFRIG